MIVTAAQVKRAPRAERLHARRCEACGLPVWRRGSAATRPGLCAWCRQKSEAERGRAKARGIKGARLPSAHELELIAAVPPPKLTVLAAERLILRWQRGEP